MAVNIDGFGYNESTDRTTNATLAPTDSGVVQNVTATTGTVTLTLPAAAAGNAGTTFIIKNTGGATVVLAPNASDGFTGNGYTATVNKTLTSTANNDVIAVRGTGTTGVTGWVVGEVSGTWTRQA